MILQRLVEYYDRLAADPANAADPMPTFGFSREWIAFAVVIDPDGNNPELSDLRLVDGKNLTARRMTVPDRGGRSGTALKPNFLWDNTGYALGVDGKGKAERSTESFEAFRIFHEVMAGRIDDDGFVAVVKFLAGWSPKRFESFALASDAIDKNVAFRVRGRQQFVHDAPAVQAAWRDMAKAIEAEAAAGQSLIGGDRAPLARLHPLISGVAGAQTMGAAIASFNDNAYESYGLVQTLNAPVSIADAFKYTTALNWMLEKPRKRRIFLGDATVTFWADAAAREAGKLVEDAAAMLWGESSFAYEDAAASAEHKARAEQVGRFLRQLREGHSTGEAIDADDRTGFHVLGLSPNASRISVRFWYDGTVGELKQRLARHLRDTELVGKREGDKPLTVKRIVEVCGRHDEKTQRYDADAVPPTLTGAVARAVLFGTPYPRLLLNQLLNRIRADGDVRHDRVAAIKACLIRSSRDDLKEVPVALDTTRTDAAYVTGRLFALLEKIQSDSAGGDLNATIKDRYFSAASATPGLVFPRLIRLSNYHLAKMETAQKIYYERQLGEVIGKLERFDAHLLLEDQGLFAVGYFHQRQDLFTKRTKEPKEEGATA